MATVQNEIMQDQFLYWVYLGNSQPTEVRTTPILAKKHCVSLLGRHPHSIGWMYMYTHMAGNEILATNIISSIHVQT